MNLFFIILDATPETVTPDLIMKTGAAFVAAVLLNFSRGIFSDIAKKRKEKKQEATTESARTELNDKVDILVVEIKEIREEQVQQRIIVEGLKEDNKRVEDSDKLTTKVNFAYESVLSTYKLDDEELDMALQNAKDGALYVLSKVFSSKFTTDKDTLEKQLKNKAKLIKRTCNWSKVESKNIDFLHSVTVGLKRDIKSFMIEYERLQPLSNGVRRAKFIDESVKFIEASMATVLQNY